MWIVAPSSIDIVTETASQFRFVLEGIRIQIERRIIKVAQTGGTYNSAQSVSCLVSGAPVMCFTTNGTTRATNGGSGCTTGTLYTGGISITTTGTTLEIIAGGTGFFEGSVDTEVGGVPDRAVSRYFLKRPATQRLLTRRTEALRFRDLTERSIPVRFRFLLR
jgi:hypothetical protein